MKTFSASPLPPFLNRAVRGLAVLVGLFPLGAAAQGTGPGSVRGRLVEAGGQPVPFSDVLLLRAADSTFVAVAQTTEQGAFNAAALPLGTYLLRVQDLNYKPLRRRFTLTAAAPTLEIPGLVMAAAAATKLAEVVVTGKQAIVQQELGKTVINVEKDLSSVGGMATDVLRNVPSVAVDASGAVSLRGSSNLTILIDGKPAGVSNGGGGGPRLDQIPASRIAQVEVMTNPSAKYDAQGTAVINIILKKNQKAGVNGQLSLTGGTGDKYFGNASFSHHRKRATWNVNYDRNDQNYRERTETGQTAQLPAGPVQTAQAGTSRERRQHHDLGLSLDYELSKEQSLSLQVNPQWERETNAANQALTTRPAGQPATTQRGEQVLDVDVKVLENVASYRRTWAKHEGRELTAVGGNVLVDAKAPVTQTLSDGALLGWQQDIKVKFNILFGQADYVLPLGGPGKSKLETGVKVERRADDGTSGFSSLAADHPADYRPDPARSYAYNYAQTVTAAYATYRRSWGPGQLWQAQGGLRAEDTRNSGAAGIAAGGGGAYALNYLEFFPTLTVGRGLGRADSAGGGERPQRLEFSYARRLNRPGGNQLLAVPIYSDPRTYQLGNPALRAEFSHNLELGHQLNLPGGLAFTSTVFARFTQGTIQRLRGVDTAATRLNPAAGLVVAETYRNYGSRTALGLELSYSQPLAKWWRVQASGSVYRAALQSNAPDAARRAAWAADVRLNQSFQPTARLDVQLTGTVRSSVLTAQGRQLPTGDVDVALRQRLFDNRAALTFRLSDVFNTQVRRAVVEAPGLTATSYTKPESRVAWLGFTWFIGASKAKAGKIEAAPQGGSGFGG